MHFGHPSQSDVNVKGVGGATVARQCLVGSLLAEYGCIVSPKEPRLSASFATRIEISVSGYGSCIEV